MTTYKSFSDALNIPHEDIDFEMVEGIDYIPHNVKRIPAWNSGTVGLYFHTDEAKKKISEAVKKNNPTKNPCIAAKMAKTKTGVPRSEETKKKISQSHVGMVSSKETKIKQSKSMKEYYTDENKKKKSELMKKWWAERKRS